MGQRKQREHRAGARRSRAAAASRLPVAAAAVVAAVAAAGLAWTHPALLGQPRPSGAELMEQLERAARSGGGDDAFGSAEEWAHRPPDTAAAMWRPEELLPPREAADRLWGTYRPGVYFGVKSRTVPAAVNLGIAWHGGAARDGGIRHDCSEADPVSYGWRRHDGVGFGFQPIEDRMLGLSLNTTFVKPDAEDAPGPRRRWASRLDARSDRDAVLYLYVSADCDAGAPCAAAPALRLGEVVDGPDGRFVDITGAMPTDAHAYGGAAAPDAAAAAPSALRIRWSAAEGGQVISFALSSLDGLGSSADAPAAIQRLRRRNEAGTWTLEAGGARSGRFHLFQLHFAGAVAVDAQFLPPAAAALSAAGVGAAAAAAEGAFLARAGAMWAEAERRSPRAVGAAPWERDACVAALSNLLGGLGHFHGRSVLSGSSGGGPAASFPATLLSMVPSRPFFPRGFLWDEGFHMAAAAPWDPLLAAESLAHWLSLMHDCPSRAAGGWIPREQVLGEAARRRVPPDFLAQTVGVANPPTLLLGADALLKRRGRPGAPPALDAALRALVAPLYRWWAHFAASQAGAAPGLYRWRGREEDPSRLVPMALASGLDDYPRALEPSAGEAHADLCAWVAFGAGAMARLLRAYAGAEGLPGGAEELALAEERRAAEAKAALEALHWAEPGGAFDVGPHCDAADCPIESLVALRCGAEAGAGHRDVGVAEEDLRALQRGALRRSPCPESHPRPLYPLGDGRGGLLRRKAFGGAAREGPLPLRRVREVGYVAFFPLALSLYEEDSPRLGATLELLADEEHLWSPHGLRSLSTRSALYKVGNKDGDAPYWRGPIWINMNYLVLRGLRGYADGAGPYAERCGDLYGRLRERVLRTVLDSWRETGYFWEQYDDETGRGARSHPFTGWTALVLRIMLHDFD